MTITNADKLACAVREVKQRERVYPRLVTKGSMTLQQASRETAIMQAIADDYRKLEEGDRLL